MKKKFEEYLQIQLKCFEKFLEENGGNGHFVGDSVSSVSHFFLLMCWILIRTILSQSQISYRDTVVKQITVADVSFAVGLEKLDDFQIDMQLDKYPLVKRAREIVTSNPKIAAWIAKRPVSEF